MKSIFFAILLLSQINSFSQFNSADLQASGLTCSMCSKAIYKALEKINFIESIDSDIKTSTYKIKFKKDVQVDFDALKNAVTDAGFSVAVLKVNALFNNVKIENDSHIKVAGNTLHFMNVKQQTLNGYKTITIVDKNYISSKDFKKFEKLTTLKCYQTGRMSTCCSKNTADNKLGDRIFHTTI